MPLLGTGALIIWHDIVPEHRHEYRHWHGSEHMPERLGVPGILRGRRYEAIRGGPEFLTIYEASGLGDITSESYIRRRADLTPWSRKMLGHFRNLQRAVADVVWSTGASSGGLCATWRFEASGHLVSNGSDSMAERLRALSAAPDVAGVHLLRADMSASTADFAVRAAQDLATDVPRWALLVESWGDGDTFAAWCLSATNGGVVDLARFRPAFGLYRVANILSRCNHGASSDWHGADD